MRRYDDPVEVRRGLVAGPGGDVEGPEQFLWRGRLWKVRGVVAQWVETGAWWQSSGVHAVLGSDEPGDAPAGTLTLERPVGTDLVAEREVWRVEAARGMAFRAVAGGQHGTNGNEGWGVFDLVLDTVDGTWRLARCVD